MSFGWKPPRQNAGEAIPAHAMNKAYEAVGNILRMTVGRGLSLSWVRNAPLIQLDGDFSCYDVLTTSTWTARVGAQYGTGKFQFLYADLAALTADAGLPEQDGFNFLGSTVASGKHGIVVKVAGTWRLIAADCT